MRNQTWLMMSIGLLFHSVAASAAADPALTCRIGKLRVAGKYGACVLGAEAKALKAGGSPDLAKCEVAFSTKWESAEAKATRKGGNCFPSDDEIDLKTLLDVCAATVVTALEGGGLNAVCGNGAAETGEDCDVGDLNGATCASQPGFLGGTLACAAGCTFDTNGCYSTRFDASGPTIIDHQTGLEWEKKDGNDSTPDYANPHDVDNVYQWSSAGSVPNGGVFTDYLPRLNGSTPDGVTVTGCYAGHCDWRLPNIAELLSVGWPAVSEFQPDAALNCWSVSTDVMFPSYAWFVATSNGSRGVGLKTASYPVRAVRSGS